MKSLVKIAYYFPPDGSASVFRPLRFLRWLPTEGWRCSVIALRSDWHSRTDPQLVSSIPPEIEVVRVADNDLWLRLQTKRARRLEKRTAGASPAELASVRRAHHRPLRAAVRRLVRVAEASLYYPDLASFWIRPAVRETIAVCRRQQPDVVMVTGGPWSAFVVAHRAWQQTGIPYVLDFQDSWTLTCNEDFEALRPDWATHRDRRLLHTLFEDARAVIFRYETEAESYWRAYPGALTRDRIHIIPNGYDGRIEAFEHAQGDRSGR
jgi:hypothetical protein